MGLKKVLTLTYPNNPLTEKEGIKKGFSSSDLKT
jgi:hypothetical protein